MKPKTNQNIYVNSDGQLKELSCDGWLWTHGFINGVDINLNTALKANAEIWELYGFTTIKNTYKP